MKLIHFCFLALMSIALAGCAGAVPWNEQNYSGINKAEIKFDELGNPSHAVIIGGKEQEDISLDVRTPSGLKVAYQAAGVKAFDGTRLRAAVETAVSSDAKEAMPGIVDSVLTAIEKVLAR